MPMETYLSVSFSLRFYTHRETRIKFIQIFMKLKIKRPVKICLFLTFLFSLAAIIAFYALFIRLPSQTHPLIFYATPKRDDLKLTFLRAIKQAKDSIWICSYGITDKDILSALKKKAAAGVRVDLIYHQKINRNLHQLKNTHFHCHPKRGKGLMHEKLLITDDTLLFFGSANFTTSSLIMHDNCLLGLYAPKLAASLKQRQLSHYNYQLKGQQLDLFILPQGKDQAFEKLIQTLDEASESISIALFTLTHPIIVDKLIALHQRGIKVQVFLDGATAKGASKKAAQSLRQAGVLVAASQGLALFHHKWALIDKDTLILGSANWTNAAFKQNNELLLFLKPLNDKHSRSLTRAIKTFQQETTLLPLARISSVFPSISSGSFSEMFMNISCESALKPPKKHLVQSPSKASPRLESLQVVNLG